MYLVLVLRYVISLHNLFFIVKDYVVSNVVSSQLLCFKFYVIVKSSIEFLTLLVIKNLCTFNCFTIHVLICMTQNQYSNMKLYAYKSRVDL